MEYLTFDMGVPIDLFQEDGTYIAACKPLDVASQGDTPEEARENCREALMMFISTCYVRGTLDQVLRDAGYVLSAQGDERRTSTKDVLPVPMTLVKDEQTRAA